MNSIKTSKKINKQRGVSLVELLVSIVIATIVLSGVISVVVTSRQSFVSEQEASFMQENARFAIELLTRDIRMAGSKDCAPDLGAWGVTAVEDGNGLFGTVGVEGFEGTADLNDFPEALEDDADVGSDAVILRYADPSRSIAISGHTAGATNEFSLLAASDFVVGDKLFIVDASCRHFAYFEATAVDNDKIEQSNTGNNCQSELNVRDTELKCGEAAPGQGRVYQPGSMILPYEVAGYFIADSNVLAGIPALKRKVFTPDGQRVEEIAQGIESMEILYGVDESVVAGEPLEPEVFLNADEVADWATVAAVRVSLILRSQSEYFEDVVDVTLNGRQYDEDRFLRQLVSSTIQIRKGG